MWGLNVGLTGDADKMGGGAGEGGCRTGGHSLYSYSDSLARNLGTGIMKTSRLRGQALKFFVGGSGIYLASFASFPSLGLAV